MKKTLIFGATLFVAACSGGESSDAPTAKKQADGPIKFEDLNGMLNVGDIGECIAKLEVLGRNYVEFNEETIKILNNKSEMEAKAKEMGMTLAQAIEIHKRANATQGAYNQKAQDLQFGEVGISYKDFLLEINSKAGSLQSAAPLDPKERIAHRKSLVSTLEQCPAPVDCADCKPGANPLAGAERRQ